MKTSARAGVVRKPPGLRGNDWVERESQFCLRCCHQMGQRKQKNKCKGRKKKKKNEFTMDMVSDT